MTQDKNPLARSIIRFEITRLKNEVDNINHQTKKLQAEIDLNKTKVRGLEILAHTLTKSLYDLP